MAKIRRANPYLEEIIEILDFHRAKYQDDSEARDHLSSDDNAWIDNEIYHCITDKRYFLSNYYAYRDEKEGFKGLYPFFDSQEILFQEYAKLKKQYGRVRALVLKARQMGSTTYNCGEFLQETIFYEHRGAIMVGKDEKQKNKMFQMYSSALDFLPWWMKPRHKAKQEGALIEFDEKDDRLRMTRPGLKTVVNWENANKPSGAGRGDTFNCAVLSELAFWDNGSQLSKSLFPTMNTPDGFYVMESTANGRNDFWHNLWRRAEAGKVDWHPIFIPFYRRAQTYFLPILKTEVFVLTGEELEMREKVFHKESYLIKDGTFKWMRARKEEFEATDGDDKMFSQEYTSTAEESFQSSAITAFPRQIINRFSKRTLEPLWVGEINYDWKVGAPKLHMRPVEKGEEILRTDNFERLHMWERVVPKAEYTLGVDVALGNPGGDYSTVQVVKKGEGIQLDEQVAVWKGLINPTALAEIVLALGWYYNEALACVEVNSYGMQTNSVLMRNYEYENIYRFKRLDRLNNAMTNIVGFYSDVKSTDALMAKMSEVFLEETIYIRDKYTMDEFRDYTEQGAVGDGAHDDLVDALMIAIYCGREGEVRERQERKKVPAGEVVIWQLKDRWGTVMLETSSRTECERMQKHQPGSSIDKVPGTGPEAMIEIAGRKIKVPATRQNTDHSPIHDEEGTANKLYQDGMEAEEITPEAIMEAEEAEEETAEKPNAWLYS